MLEGEVLGPVAATAATSDLLSTIAAPLTGILRDRGVALEQSLERNWEKAYGSNLFDGSLSGLWPARPWPALILNASLSARGQIAFMSNLNDVGAGTLDFPDLKLFGMGLPTMRVSTAVVNSARFPGISPGGRVTLTWGKNEAGGPILIRPSRAGSYAGPIEEKYFDTLVDGGYGDNYGATALLRLTSQIDDIQCKKLRVNISARERYAESCAELVAERRFVRYVLIQITSDPSKTGTCTEPPAFIEGIFNEVSEIPDFLSPLATLMNTRSKYGIGLAVRLKDHIDGLYRSDNNSRHHGRFAPGDSIINDVYYHFGLGPLSELPDLDEGQVESELREFAAMQAAGASEEEVRRRARELAVAGMERIIKRRVNDPRLEGRSPPLNWTLSRSS